jgi:hypothetical protein
METLEATIFRLAEESLRLARPGGDLTQALFCLALHQMIAMLNEIATEQARIVERLNRLG